MPSIDSGPGDEVVLPSVPGASCTSHTTSEVGPDLIFLSQPALLSTSASDLQSVLQVGGFPDVALRITETGETASHSHALPRELSQPYCTPDWFPVLVEKRLEQGRLDMLHDELSGLQVVVPPGKLFLPR